MWKFFNKVRQVFNLFLIMLLIAAAAAVFIYFLTTPEQRDTTFWMSIGFLIFALLLETFMAMGIAMRSNGGKEIPTGFAKVVWGGLYFVFVIAVSVWNAFAGFSVTKYLLIHVGGLVVFLLPMILLNMATLRLSGADRKEREQGRQNLSSLANRIENIIEDISASGLNVPGLMNLAERLRYSDPAPASGKLEKALEDAVKNLEIASEGKNSEEIARACVLAERALKERNDYVINSK